MSTGFISAVEKAFAQENRFWHLIFYNEQAIPIACASACTFNVDLVTLASARMKKFARIVRRYFPECAKIKALFCGLPVSLGQNHFVIKPGADSDQVLQLLDDVLARDLAQLEKARLIIYKEFDAVTCEVLRPLGAAGYYCAEGPATYMFHAGYKNFSDYCGALNSHYRNDIRRSQRKFERAGLAIAHLHDSREILRLYDKNVHRLYETVVEKSNVKLEQLPIEFFHSLVKQFPSQVSLTVVRRENRVVAFNWGLQDHGAFYFVFCGIDYRENAEADLYFNLMYHQLDYALSRGPEYISVGQTADSFKSRLGCRPRRLYFYIKGIGPVFSALVGKFPHVLFPKPPSVPEYSIFKTKSAPARAPKLKPRELEYSDGKVTSNNLTEAQSWSLRPLELAHAAAALCLVILTTAFAVNGRLIGWSVPAICSGSLILIVAAMVWLSRREAKLPLGVRLLLNFYPVITVTAVFEILGSLLPAGKWCDGDRLLIWADRALLGTDPTVWMERFVRPEATDILYLAYASYHVLPVVLGIMIWKKNQEIAILFIFSITFAFFVNYAGYFLLPAQGPYAALVDWQSITLEVTPISRAVHEIMSRLEHPKLDAFPSAHAMATVFCLLFSFAYERRFFYLVLPLGVLIIVSLVYCRYHYVVDVIAGGLLAVVLFPASQKLYWCLAPAGGLPKPCDVRGGPVIAASPAGH